MTRSIRQPASSPRPAFVGGPPVRLVTAHDTELAGTRILPADPHAAKLAREFTRATLPGWGHDELVEDVTLVTCELVTNAVRHGGRQPIRLALIAQAACVLSLVHDCGSTPPSVISARGTLVAVDGPASPEPDPLREAGRGLGIVARLATTWGWTRPDGNGKTVWAIFATTDRTADQRPTPTRPHRNQPPTLHTAAATTLPRQPAARHAARQLPDWIMSRLLDSGPSLTWT